LWYSGFLYWFFFGDGDKECLKKNVGKKIPHEGFRQTGLKARGKYKNSQPEDLKAVSSIKDSSQANSKDNSSMRARKIEK